MTCELPADMGSPECDECMVGSCCGAMDACVADQECIDALHCADTCALESEDDTEFGACLDACFGGPEPPHLLDEIFICQVDHCEEACFSGG
jgi:hypothetical protein